MLKKFNIGTDRIPLPVRVEGEAQGVAAPQHQLADLVDGDDDVDVDDDIDVDDDVDIYIMTKCLSVCLSRKMSTSSWESPVTT